MLALGAVVGVLAFAAVIGACGGASGGSVEVRVVEESTSPGTGTAIAPTQTPLETAAPASPTAPAPSPTVAEAGDAQGGEHLPCGDMLVPIDKERALAADCAPGDLVPLPAQWVANGTQYLRAEAAEALVRMLEDARAAGHEIRVTSAYRSYEEQAWTFDYWVRQLGEAEARRTSAEPGHSEHQLGTTVDLSTASLGWALTPEFGDTAAGRWLAENAWRYGFVMSYPEGSEPVTGYAYEPWHWRYVGVGVATEIRELGVVPLQYLRARWNGR